MWETLLKNVPRAEGHRYTCVRGVWYPSHYAYIFSLTGVGEFV